MRFNIFLLVATSVGLAVADGCNDQNVLTACIQPAGAESTCQGVDVASAINNPCVCSKASLVVSCYSAYCGGDSPQANNAASASDAICPHSTAANNNNGNNNGNNNNNGNSNNGNRQTSNSGNSYQSSTPAAAQSTRTNTLATITATGTAVWTATWTELATGTGTELVQVTSSAETSTQNGNGNSNGGSSNAGQESTSQAWGERNLVLPAGGAIAAVLGLAVLL